MRAFSQAVMDEKSMSPLFPEGGGVCVWGGAVVTNDWCIKPEIPNFNCTLLVRLSCYSEGRSLNPKLRIC